MRTERKFAKGTPIIYREASFKSKLEGRWAFFFDLEGIKWQYEPRQFHLSNGSLYTPDFWLPQVNMFAEMKPDEFTEEELRKCCLLHQDTGYPVLLINDKPKNELFKATDRNHYSVSGYHDYHIKERRFFCNEYDPLDNDTITEHAEQARVYRFRQK